MIDLKFIEPKFNSVKGRFSHELQFVHIKFKEDVIGKIFESYYNTSCLTAELNKQ